MIISKLILLMTRSYFPNGHFLIIFVCYLIRMKNLFLFLLLLPLLARSQNQSLDTIKAPHTYDGIYSRMVASDSLSSSFVIFIKKEVKKHKHASHTENVYILEGEGEMVLGDMTFRVKKG